MLRLESRGSTCLKSLEAHPMQQHTCPRNQPRCRAAIFHRCISEQLHSLLLLLGGGRRRRDLEVLVLVGALQGAAMAGGEEQAEGRAGARVRSLVAVENPQSASEHKLPVPGIVESSALKAAWQRQTPAALPKFSPQTSSPASPGSARLTSGVDSVPGPTCSQGDAASAKLRNAWVSCRGSYTTRFFSSSYRTSE